MYTQTLANPYTPPRAVDMAGAVKHTARRSPWPLVSVSWVALAFACSQSGGASGTQPGSAPTNLVAGPLGGGVHLTWLDNSDDEQLFEIERMEQGTSFAVLDSVPFNSALYHDANVTLGIQYTYRVRAKLPIGFSDYSNQASADPGAATGSGGSGAGGGSGTGGPPDSGGQLGVSGTAGANGSGGTSSGGSSVSGSGGMTSAGSAGMPATNPDVSFKTDVAPALVKSCGSTTAGCHNSDQAVGRIKPQYGPCKVIWYSAVDAPLGATYTSGPNQGQSTGCPDLDLYERLIGLHSMLCAAPTWDQRARYVVPGDLDASLLYQVIAGDPSMGGVCTSLDQKVRKMPLVDPNVLPNGVALSAQSIANIRDWILQGAKNN
jgi:hypothetical protein